MGGEAVRQVRCRVTTGKSGERVRAGVVDRFPAGGRQASGTASNCGSGHATGHQAVVVLLIGFMRPICASSDEHSRFPADYPLLPLLEVV